MIAEWEDNEKSRRFVKTNSNPKWIQYSVDKKIEYSFVKDYASPILYNEKLKLYVKLTKQGLFWGNDENDFPLKRAAGRWINYFNRASEWQNNTRLSGHYQNRLASSADMCQYICLEDQECVASSFANPKLNWSTNCFLYKKDFQKSYEEGWISYIPAKSEMFYSKA